MTIVYLKYGRYPTGQYPCCSTCGKEPYPKGCTVATDWTTKGDVRIVTCDTCLLEAVREERRRRKSNDRQQPHRREPR